MKTKLSSSYTIIIITFIILSGLAVFIIRPTATDIMFLYKQKQEKEIELEEAKQKEEDLKKIEDNYEDITNQVTKAFKAMPSEKEVSDLVIQIEALSKESGNILKTIQFVAEEEGKEGEEKEEGSSSFTQTKESEKYSGFYELPIQIKIDTDFYKLLDLLSIIENLSRYTNIVSLNIKANESDNSMEVSISMVCYIKP